MSRTFRIRHKNRRRHRSTISSNSIRHINAATKIVDHYNTGMICERKRLEELIISLITDKPQVHAIKNIFVIPGIMCHGGKEAIKYGVSEPKYTIPVPRNTYTSYTSYTSYTPHNVEKLVHYLTRHRIYELSWCIDTDRDIFGVGSFNKDKRGTKLRNKRKLEAAVASRHYDEL